MCVQMALKYWRSNNATNIIIVNLSSYILILIVNILNKNLIYVYLPTLSVITNWFIFEYSQKF